MAQNDCYACSVDFLAFFDQHGGLASFGNPISAFESSRMDAFLSQPPGNLVPIEVQVTLLGVSASTTTSFRTWH